MLRGLTALETRRRSSQNPPQEIGLVEKKEIVIDGGKTDGSPLTRVEEAAVTDGPAPVAGEWAKEMRAKDELISHLTRQLAALGEQPMDEIVTLEVRQGTHVH